MMRAFLLCLVSLRGCTRFLAYGIKLSRYASPWGLSKRLRWQTNTFTNHGRKEDSIRHWHG